MSFEGLDHILKQDYEILEGQQNNLLDCDVKNLYLTPYELGIKHFHDNLSLDISKG